MTPAEEMIDAARILRERAQWTTPPPWDYDQFEDNGPWAVVWDGPQGDPGTGMVVVAETGRGRCDQQDARWIATMHPGVGEPLAAWLQREAKVANRRHPSDDNPALTLARVIRSQHQAVKGGEPS